MPSTTANVSPSTASGRRRAPRRRTGCEIALLLSTYQRPAHLRRSLASIARQRDVAGRFELVVTDDGSTDETSDLVTEFASQAKFPVRFTTHPHDGFQLSRSRNEGVGASEAPYLLFLDGDCILPPDHVALHLARRRSGIVMAGDVYYLDEATSRDITPDAIGGGDFSRWPSSHERKRLDRKLRRARVYNLFGHSRRPRLSGGNVGMWREDYERVNGYDENFVGWGLEDHDLQRRLARHGVRFRSSLGWTRCCHLWHPRTPSFARNCDGKPNRTYYERPGRLSRCRHGLRSRSLADIAAHVEPTQATHAAMARQLAARFADAGARPEVEFVLLPGPGRFSGRAECNVLLLLDNNPPPSRLARQADLLVSDRPHPAVPAERQFRLQELSEALDAIV